MGVVTHVGGPNEQAVMRETWGHLRARPNVRHHGTIIFAEGAFGEERVILDCDLGDGAGYGPWFYEQVHEWLWEQDTEPAKLYTFTGWYRVGRDDSYEFRGEILPADLRSG